MNNKIIDCFTFYNELKMLHFRFEELYDYVDNFILVESTHTFTGHPKKMYFNENKSKFKKYLDKIIHVMVTDFPYTIKTKTRKKNKLIWKNEYFQRQCIKRGLDQLNLQQTDIILISDVDEIVDNDVLSKIKNNEILIDRRFSLEQDFYNFNFTFKNYDKWYYSQILDYSTLITEFSYDVDKVRRTGGGFSYHGDSSIVIKNAGWHLSFFQNPSEISKKIKTFSHTEFNEEKFTNITEIEDKIKNKEDLFSRNFEKWYTIDLEKNNYLPKNYQMLI